ncbi:MAG: hypothetical protein KA712_06660 [Myxococcales bacterium]|nr:hypothetical protein [Myxococcales bacterium]
MNLPGSLFSAAFVGPGKALRDLRGKASLPARRAVWRLPGQSPKQRRLLLGAGAVALALVFVPTLLGREPVAPKPVKPALRGPLKQAEHAIADGQIPEAKAILMQQLSSHPDSARVHFLLGTIAFSESDPDAGLERYGEALALDPGLRGDAALLYNVKALLADRRRDVAALAFLAEKVGAPAGETLAEIASRDLRSHFRQTARAACETHDCLDDVDLVGSFELDLRQAKTCDAKREAIGGLTATRDARVIDILKKARRNRSGTLGRWLGLEGGNDCVRKEIEDALKELGAS